MRSAPELLLALVPISLFAVDARAEEEIPAVYANLERDAAGSLVLRKGGKVFPLMGETPQYTLRQVRGNPSGTADGFRFEFLDPAHAETRRVAAGGTLFYALVDTRERLPVPKFKRATPIDANGVALAPMHGRYDGKYDYIGWRKHKRGALYYRVADARGGILYEGRLYFTGNGPFEVDPGSIVDGPFLNLLSSDGAVISFESLRPAVGSVAVEGVGEFKGERATRHEIRLRGLEPGTRYRYTVSAGGSHSESYTLATAPRPGTRRPFTFAFASDSRSGINSGERHIGGTNAYMMRKLAALALQRGVAFVQFTGDEIDGYRNHPESQRVEYANWRRSILPWASHVPVVAGMGNHEALMRVFVEGSRYGLGMDRFPFATESAEALFAEAFVNPLNGPESEDGAAYDPDPDRTDFPTYKENVYFYTYDNVAMVVLNSNYWYAPAVQYYDFTVGGNPHGYLMDNQIAWLRATLAKLERDPDIDHVFVTHHTPAWPNGGHVADDMFYGGDNRMRPWIAGKPHSKGILERRDEYWRVLMAARKVVAILTGDEHNYARLEIRPGMPVYREGGFRPANPLEITRTILQVHNGAAGAPYYAREKTPWNADFDSATGSGAYLKHFTTENALVFFHVDGKRIRLEVVNPDTLDRIE